MNTRDLDIWPEASTGLGVPVPYCSIRADGQQVGRSKYCTNCFMSGRSRAGEVDRWLEGSRLEAGCRGVRLDGGDRGPQTPRPTRREHGETTVGKRLSWETRCNSPTNCGKNIGTNKRWMSTSSSRTNGGKDILQSRDAAVPAMRLPRTRCWGFATKVH